MTAKETAPAMKSPYVWEGSEVIWRWANRAAGILTIARCLSDPNLQHAFVIAVKWAGAMLGLGN